MSLTYLNLLLAITGLLQVVIAGKPQKVKISGPEEVIAGVDALYECSALCTGLCHYSWIVGGQTVDGSTFTLTTNGENTVVSLTCLVSDEKQMNFESTVISVTVINPISVRPSKDQPVLNREPKVGRSFKLTCDGATPPVTIIWLKGFELLTLNSRMSLSPDNTTLSFSSLEAKDSGEYRCKVLNGSAAVISKGYWIYFGFVQVGVTGPRSAELGFETEYTCSAECGVGCTVQWALRTGFPKGRFIADGPKIRWTPSELGQTQVFTCLALNPVAGKLGEVSVPVTVIEARPRPSPSNAISARPSVAMVISATLLMLVSALA
ncbi:hemicentin-2-like [Colossoma macropomum]|uniref:hemicentin-2-like n=1 Tax=Colossoma macropomum TaxID=42526 RepID=UPI0018644DFF|nr:hemicentin-2-like [Colossoma macropomum]